MSRIESLTPEQIARFVEFRDRWKQIGLCTDPADRPRAEAAIRNMYRQGGLEPPRRIAWCGSPLSQALTRAAILDKKLIEPVGASVRRRVWAGVAAGVAASVWENVWDNVWASVWANVAANVATSVWQAVGVTVRESLRDVAATVEDGVWDSVQSVVGDHVSSIVRDSLRHSVVESVADSVYGPNEAYSLAFYRYFHEVAGLREQTAKLAGLWELAQSAGWALPHQHMCWVAERHNILALDDRGRLHSLTGPACAYPDGWTIYAVHGVRVPRYVIERPREIDIARIGAESNIAVRRVMIERYRYGEDASGTAAYIRDSGAMRLDHDERFGTLWRRNIPDDEPIVMIEVINSTPEPDGRRKHYWLRVPPTVTTACEAVAWTFGVRAKDYAPSVET